MKSNQKAKLGVLEAGFKLPGLAFVLALVLLAPTILMAAPPAGYYQVWGEEFNGSALDSRYWSCRYLGPHDMGYNATNGVSCNGSNMVITTYTSGGTNFTAEVVTDTLLLFKYGYFESSIQFSDSPGEHSAIWVQSSTVSSFPLDNPAYNGTEIDVCEHRKVDGRNNDINSNGIANLHWNGYDTNEQSASSGLITNGNYGIGYHTYALLWTATNYTFTYDNTNQVWSTGTAVSHRSESISLTSDVGVTNWAGTIPVGGYGDLTNSTTKMAVDYVRYYAPTTTVFWSGTVSGGWTNSANWTAGMTPNANSDVIFWALATNNLSTTLNQNYAVNSLSVLKTYNYGPVFIAGSTLTVGAGGIDLVSAVNDLNLNLKVVLGASQSWIVATNCSINMNAELGGSGNLSADGFGAVTLSASNSYTGDTRILNGGLNVQHANALQFTTVDMNTNDVGTLSLANPGVVLGGLKGGRDLSLGSGPVSVGNNGQSTTYDGSLSGPGSLAKVGAGTLTLTGASTYGGPTTVSGGTLLVNGSLGANTVTVLTNGTLGGVGTITGSVLVTNAAALSPGSAVPGVLTINGALTLAANSTSSFQINKGGVSDQIAGLSGVTYGGALNVTSVGAALAEGDTFTVFSASSYSGAFASINLPSLSTGLAWDTSELAVNGTISVSNITCTLTYAAGANGTISGTSPQTVNYGGSGTAVTAVPNTSYYFVNWSDGSTGNPRTDLNVTNNITVTANFAINSYTQPLTATVDWGAFTGVVANNSHYGLDAYLGCNPSIAGTPGNATYKTNFSYMHPGLVRNFPGYWAMSWVTNPTNSNYGWDATTISNALTGSFSYGPVRMINTGNWPAYLGDGNGFLKTTNYDAYANFCSNLVVIVNVQLGFHVKYWEAGNEEDGTYTTNLSEYAAIYNKVAVAMKAADPTIKVGGPAFSWVSTAHCAPFVTNAYPNLDFISYHSYPGSASTNLTDAQIWDDATNLGPSTTDVIQALVATVTNKPIETFLDEYNINYHYTGTNIDLRMANAKGAVFDALAMVSVVNSGTTGGAAWNECDGVFGKMDGSYNLRPSAYVYRLFNSSMVGPVVNTASSDASKLVMFAQKNGSTNQFALINRSGANQTVQLTFSGWQGSMSSTNTFAYSQVSSNGLATGTVTYGTLTNSSGWMLPVDTVTVLTINDSNTVTNIQGTTLTWNTGSSTIPQDGSGIWNNANLTWLYGNGNILWNDGNLAAFGTNTTTNCTVTLANDVAPTGITFNATGGGSYTIAGNNTISTANGLNIVANGNGFISAVISGSGSLTKSGAGALTVSSTNAYSGVTTISQGSIVSGTSNTLSSSIVLCDTNSGSNPVSLWIGYNSGILTRSISVANQGSGTVTIGSNPNDASGTAQYNGSISLNRGVTFYNGAGANRMDVKGVISGSGDLTVDGSVAATKKVVFTQTSDNSFAGNIYITGTGYFQLSDGSVSKMNSLVPDTASVNLNLAGGVFALAKGGNNETIDALNGVAGTMVKAINGNDTLTIGGNNGSGTFAGVISNTGTWKLALTKTGTGTETLSGTNAYTGVSTIIAGTLQLDGSLGTNSVTVANTATLAGTGTANGAVTVQAGGALAPGDDGIGSFAVNNSLTLNGGSFTAMEIAKNSGVLSNDLVSVTGTLTSGGSLVVTNIGTDTLAAGDSFTLFNAGTFGGGFTNVILPALGAGLVWNTNNLPVNGTIAVSNLTCTLTYTAGSNGSISGNSPQTVNYGGSGSAVTAVPDTGYSFVNWSDGSTANPRTDMNVTSNLTVTANFAGSGFTLTYAAGPNGSISGASPQTVAYGGSGSPVTAVANTNYHFVSWSDGSTANPRTDVNVTSNLTVTASFASGLPSPWTTNAIGSLAAAVSANYSGQTFVVTGAGAGLTGKSDSCWFVNLPATNSFTITALVTSQETNGAAPLAGVMIRQDTSGNSLFAFMGLTPNNQAEWISRTSTRGKGSMTTFSGFTAPYWVRIVRGTNTFTGYVSADGTSWTQTVSVNLTMSSNVLAGLVVSSGSGSTLNTAVFDDVTLDNNGGVPLFHSNVLLSASAQMESFTVGGGSADFTITGDSDTLWRLEDSNDLTTWVPLETINLIGGSVDCSQDDDVRPARFFRLVPAP